MMGLERNGALLVSREISEVLGGGAETAAGVLVEPLDEGLLERLRFEFGDRVVDFLLTAQGWLTCDVGVPCLGETVAYCLRQAFREILKSSSIGGGEFKELSREVVEAKQRYENPEGSSGDGRPGGLEQVWEAIDDLDRFHRDQEDLTVRQLREVVVNGVGRVLLPGQVKRFRSVWGRANKGLRGVVSASEARRFWSDCVDLLGQLFMPPSQRLAEIEALAGLGVLSAEDVASLDGLLSGPDHVRWFFSKVKYPGWLDVLEREASELLQPMEDKDKELLEWPALAVVSSLLPDHRARVEHWLEGMYDAYGKVMVEVPWRSEEEVARTQRWAVMVPDSGNEDDPTEDEPWTEPVWAHQLALVALHAEPPMADIVLRAVKDHPTSRDIVLVGVSAVRKIPPSDSSVMDFANMLLTESCWNAWPHSDSVVERLVEGINQRNAVDRVKMLCYKIRPSPNTRIPTFFEANRDGTVVEIANDPPYRGRLFVLTKCLTDAITRAQEWVTTQAILDVLRAVSLPPGLAGRLRAWTLATSSDPDHELWISEVEEAIVSGSPTGDHRRLLDRVVDKCDPSSYAIRWCRALGVAPDVEQMERVLDAAQFPPYEWVRAWQWVLLLPNEISMEWAAACQALESKYGQPDRTGYEYRPRRATRVTSPIGVGELQIVDPMEAAREIAQWRPDTADWRVTHAGARELGLTLETLVKENPNYWTADPVNVVKTLRHPTYINHYLRGVADVASPEMPINELLDVIRLVRPHPWEVEVLGTGDSDYDHDWSGVKQAAVERLRRPDRRSVGPP